MQKFYLPTPHEFSFELCLEFLKRSPKEKLHTVEGIAVLKHLYIEDQSVLIRVSGKTNRLMVEVLTDEVSDSIINRIKLFVSEWFDLAADLKAFYTMVKKDALLGDLVKKYFGYRVVGQPDLYESLIWAVLGQQINLTFAYTLKQRFVEQFGKSIEWMGNQFYRFPDYEVVAKLKPEDLLPLQFSKQKANYTVGISQAFAEGRMSKEKLVGLNLTQAKEELIKIKGIGNWTANYALMKTFRYPDAFPLEDAGVHNAIKNLKGLKAKPSLDQVRRIFKKYKGWEAYATLYLWKSL
jgi:DNA-3-methyladenine glycosylase II